MTAADPDEMTPQEIAARLKPGPIACLETIFCAEIEEGMTGRPVVPVKKKTPARIVAALEALGLVEVVNRNIPAPPGCIPIPTTVKVPVLTHLGRYVYGLYAATQPEEE